MITKLQHVASPQASRSAARADTIINWLRSYSERRLNSRVMDERRTISPNIVLDFGNQGLLGLQVPTRFGGLGLSTVDTLRIFEQLAAIDLNLALLSGVHNNLGMRPLLNFGTESLKAELLPMLASGRQLASFALSEPHAASNPNAIRSIAAAAPGGWTIRGEKQWIGLASWASVLTVFTKSLDAHGQSLGTSAYIVRENNPGLRHGPESLTMGVRSIVQNSVYLDDAFVADAEILGKPGEGMRVAQDAMMFSRLILAAASVGGMKRCCQLMARYGERRSISTGKLLDNPISISRLSEIIAACDAVESLAYKIAAWLDEGLEVPAEAYLACKISGPEYLWQASDSLVQFLGGRGYAENNIASQLLRDARLLRIFEGPTETLLGFLGASVLEHPESFTNLLSDRLKGSQIANAFLNAISQLRETSSRKNPASTAANRQWLSYQSGRLATAAMLWATVADSKRLNGVALNSSVDWAARQFSSLRDSLLTIHEPSGFPSLHHLSDRLDGFREVIGDIEQRLPGEETQLDQYLSKEFSAENPRPRFEFNHTPPTFPAANAVSTDSAAILETEPTIDSKDHRIHRTVFDCVISWLRKEVDPATTSVDSDSSFLSLGIDSVGAATIGLAIEEAIGQQISPDLLYEFRTINQLSAYLSSRLHRSNDRRTVNTETAKSESSSMRIEDRREQNGNGHPPPLLFSQPPLSIPVARFSSGVNLPARESSLVRQDQNDWAKDYVERNGLVARLRKSDRYFYAAPFSRFEGNYGILNGERYLLLASFGYLGLVGHPEVNTAVKAAIDCFGAGCHGTPLIAGTTALHRDLECRLASFLNAEDAVVYPSGFITNVSTVQALVGRGDLVVGDELNHTSIVDGCQLSAADFRTFRHNDVSHLERLLTEHSSANRRLVIVDGVYSMEGDLAPLPDIVEICQRHNAILMVDEAHSFGVVGKTGRGVQEHFGLPNDAIQIKMATLSKALGSQGGVVAGRRDLIDYLRHNSRGFVFSTSLGPPQVAASLAALKILEREPERPHRLQRNSARLVQGLKALGFRLPVTESAVIPVLCDDEQQALEMTALCRKAKMHVIPIFYPAVPMNAPRLRLNVLASHTDEEIDFALSTLATAGREVQLIR